MTKPTGRPVGRPRKYPKVEPSASSPENPAKAIVATNTAAPVTPVKPEIEENRENLELALFQRGQMLKDIVSRYLTARHSRTSEETAKKLVKWLELTADGVFCKQALEQSGISWASLQGLCQHKAVWELRKMAVEQGRHIQHEYMEQCAYKRATDGVERPVFYKGDQCGVLREFSDRLAERFLEAGDPARFRPAASGAGSSTNVGILVQWDFSEEPEKKPKVIETHEITQTPMNTGKAEK